MRKLPVVVVLGLFFLVRPAGATRLVSLSIRQLVQRSCWVVLGRIRRVESFWAGRKILTRNVVEVREVWKGARVEQLRFLTLGGTVGRYAMRVIGAPRFVAGQDVVIFLARRGRRLFVTGMVQGAFHLARRAGRVLACRLLGAASWAGPPPRRVWTLDGLRSEVAASVRRREP